MENWKRICNCTLGLFKCSAVAPLFFQRASIVKRTGRLLVGPVTSCQPWGRTGLRARDTAPPEEDLWLSSKARGFRYVWPSFLARGPILLVRLVQPCSVSQNFLSQQGVLMYWIGLSQSAGTWTWVDNTVLQKRWMIKSFDSAENIAGFLCKCSPLLLWGSTREPPLLLLKFDFAALMWFANSLQTGPDIQKRNKRLPLAHGSFCCRYWAEEAPHGDCVYLKTRDHAERNWIRENCNHHSYFICQMQIK